MGARFDERAQQLLACTYLKTQSKLARHRREIEDIRMSADACLASHEYQSGKVQDSLEFLKRTRSELRMLRKVRVFRDRLHVIDINGDYFEILGLGYPDPDVVPVLDNVNTAYKRELIHKETDDEFKEFKTGRRYAWAADRVM